MLGRDLQMAADVVGRQLVHVFRRKLGQVHADAAGDQHLADARLRAGAAHQLDERAVVGAQQLADRRMHARQPFALRLDLGPRAAHLIHVGRRAADVADDAGELRIGGHLADFAAAPIPATATG